MQGKLLLCRRMFKSIARDKLNNVVGLKFLIVFCPRSSWLALRCQH